MTEYDYVSRIRDSGEQSAMSNGLWKFWPDGAVPAEIVLAALENTELHIKIDYFPMYEPGKLRFMTYEIIEMNLASNSLSDGIFRLFDMVFQYAKEYMDNFDAYSKDQRRKHHLPFVLRALLLGTSKNLYQMVDVVNLEEIKALLENEEESCRKFEQQLSSEEDSIYTGIYLKIRRERKRTSNEISEEDKKRLEADVKCEFERQMCARLGYSWALQGAE